jgi:ribosomal protein S18 acetylase RimI-like enzyme
MTITQKDDTIIFNDLDEKSLANISLNKNHDLAFLELIKVDQKCRRRRCATRMMYKMLKYLKSHHYKKISLSPLPLEANGIKLNELISFYEYFGFKKSIHADQTYPYLMEKNL